MNILFYLSILILATLSCNNPNNGNKFSHYPTSDSLIIPKDSSSYYFPLMIKDENSSLMSNALDTSLNAWYSKMLFALHEPVLFNYSGNEEIFRFTWLRTFHNPIVLRIQKDKERITLKLKASSGAGGYEPGKIIIDTTFSISAVQWNKFVRKFESFNFWNFPVLQEGMRGTDGSEWILEAIQNKKYHVASRWSSRNDNFGKCCVYLLELSQLNVPQDQKY
jgi:hypothetical protein